jgi:PAS domain S-box-containing protein
VQVIGTDSSDFVVFSIEVLGKDVSEFRVEYCSSSIMSLLDCRDAMKFETWFEALAPAARESLFKAFINLEQHLFFSEIIEPPKAHSNEPHRILVCGEVRDVKPGPPYKIHGFMVKITQPSNMAQGDNRELAIKKIKKKNEDTKLALDYERKERGRIKEQLLNRLRYEKALAAISSILLTGIDKEDAMDRTLHQLLYASGADRVYAFENFEDPDRGLCTRQTHEACAPGVKPQITNPELQNIAFDMGYAHWAKKLSQGTPVIETADDFLPGARENLENQGIQSLLILPLWQDGRWVGIMGFDDTHQKRKWSRDDVGLLHTAARMVGAYRERQQAQTDLLESNRNYRVLLDALPDGVFVVDHQWRQVLVNRTGELFTGLPREKTLGEKITDVFPQLRDTKFLPALKEVMDGRKARTVKDRFVFDDGREGWYEVRVQPVADGLLCISTDITERIISGQEIRTAKEKFEKVFMSERSGIFILDNTEKLLIQDCNPAACRMFNYEKGEILGRAFGLLHSDDALLSSFRATMKKQVETIGFFTIKNYSMRSKDGSLFPTENTMLPLLAEKGRLEGWVSVVIDITERKRSEDSLKESEARYRALFEDSPTPLWEWDLSGLKLRLRELQAQGGDGRIEQISKEPESLKEYLELIDFMDANKACLDLFGVEEKNELHSHLESFFLPDTWQAFGEQILRVAQGKTSFHAETMCRTLSGKRLYVAIHAAVVPGYEDTLSQVLLSLIDLTERKQAQMRMEQMAAGVAHNFNNVLNAMTANAQAAQGLLDSEGYSEREVVKLLENVVSGAMSGKDMVRRLSSYVTSRRKDSSQWEILDLYDLISTALEIVGATTRGQGRFKWLFQNYLDQGLYVKGSSGELLEVFMNLINNAVEAMPRGGALSVSYRLEKGFLEVNFHDEGMGMEQDTMENLFEPFFSTKGVKGRGLGLVSSKGIINSMAGEIKAVSRPGHGSTIIVSLPCAEAPSGRLEREVEPKPSVVKGLQVVLVEDEALVAMGISAILREAGYLVRHIGGVNEFRGLLEEFYPDLVVCDFGLPDGSAWDVAKLIVEKAAPGKKIPAPLVIITGWSREQLPGKRPDNVPEPWSIIQKPVDRKALLKVMAEAVQNSGKFINNHPQHT